MSEIAEHAGSCHCGKVEFEATFDASKGMTCNCSICSRRGTILGSVPDGQFKLLRGSDAMTEYQFGRKRIHHFFCATCGVAAFSRGTNKQGEPMYAVNLRCLEELDLKTVTVTEYDGKSLPLH